MLHVVSMRGDIIGMDVKSGFMVLSDKNSIFEIDVSDASASSPRVLRGVQFTGPEPISKIKIIDGKENVWAVCTKNVIYLSDGHKQPCGSYTINAEEITCLESHPKKPNNILVATRSSGLGNSSLHLWDKYLEKSIDFDDTGSRDVTCATFSTDGKILACATGAAHGDDISLHRTSEWISSNEGRG